MSKDLKGSCRNLYMRGHTVENVAQTMESDMVKYLKRKRNLMVKLNVVVVVVVVVVFRSHLGSYSNLSIVLVSVGCESRGSQKA